MQALYQTELIPLEWSANLGAFLKKQKIILLVGIIPGSGGGQLALGCLPSTAVRNYFAPEFGGMSFLTVYLSIVSVD
ncbi:hypothetical protein EGT74_11660 [Chitinophaga lutea]|uniref:Uncharacterized protein n=1 Tax=Chitinophaga lutea TaxID=2488634 RepID=A0A3N4Q1L9_9BACT|nr:hypothetical protein EGT74_11660 [Chitinophaga lutea]